MRLGALSWADVGFGAPPVVYAFYLIKHFCWFFAWRAFAAYATGPLAAPPPGETRRPTPAVNAKFLVQTALTSNL